MQSADPRAQAGLGPAGVAPVTLIVGEEDASSPYSDQKIVELLRSQGIDIARRTVAKYRDTLGVLPSSKRKRYY